MLQKILAMLRSRDGRDSLLTYGAEGLAMVGMVLAYRLAAQEGRHELDLYVVVRRTVSFIFPLLLLGAVVGITRFVAMKSRPEERRRYLIASLYWVVPMAGSVFLIGVLFPEQISWVVFGSGSEKDLVPPLALMIAGIALYGLGYSFQRGRRQLVTANSIQVLALAAVPCLAFFLSNELVTICWGTGIAWMAIALFAMLPAISGPSPGSCAKERGDLLRYGLPRVPGDMALGALLTLPVYVVARTHGLTASGEIGFGTTLLNLAAALFSPLALILLPASASQLASGDHAGLSARIRKLTRLTLAACIGITLVFELAADPILHVYLGENYKDYVFMSRVIFLGAMPFGFFVGLRSVLDAYYHTPRNGINLITALMLLLIGSAIHFIIPTPAIFVAGVLVLALTYLGYATWSDIHFVRTELTRLAERSSHALNIVVVIPAREGSGAYPFAYRQANALERDHGAEVTYFHLNSRTSPFVLLGARRRFKALLKSARPDVVLVYYGSVSALFTVLSSAVPVVVSFQGSDLNRTPSDGFFRDLFGRIFSQLAAFFAAGIVCVSERLRDRLWWRTAEARVFPLGVEPEVFLPMDKAECRKQLGWNDDDRVILFNGNNPGVKRLDIAEAVMQRLVVQYPGARLEVLKGKVPYDRVPVLLNAADALLLCSDSEGSPSMVKEAMMCGLPVVCNDVGDTPDRLRGVVPGKIVAQDAHALSTALAEVLADGRRSNGRQLAVSNGCDARSSDAGLIQYLREITIHA
ncbi:MAG: glycosyltransferase [Flavobacteriales bacterium]|jgi:teichuronic acid biosynthesis glycosyltransferase TuaC